MRVSMPKTVLSPDFMRKALALCAVLAMSACATSQPGGVGADGINDPHEQANRKVHAFNRSLDRALVRPAARGYSTVLPDEIEDSVGDFATNLGQPSVVVNSLLQGDLKGAGVSTARFLVNTVVGVGGLINAADELNMPDHDTDFGARCTHGALAKAHMSNCPDWARQLNATPSAKSSTCLQTL